MLRPVAGIQILSNVFFTGFCKWQNPASPAARNPFVYSMVINTYCKIQNKIKSFACGQTSNVGHVLHMVKCNAKPLLKIRVLLLRKCEAKFKHWAMRFHRILQAAKSGLPSCDIALWRWLAIQMRSPTSWWQFLQRPLTIKYQVDQLSFRGDPTMLQHLYWSTGRCTIASSFTFIPREDLIGISTYTVEITLN